MKSTGQRAGVVFVLGILSVGSIGMRAAEIQFQRVEVANNADSQFTNVADINGDGNPDILAFKGGDDGFLSWYEYPGFQHRIVQRGNFNAGRPAAADIDEDGDMDLVVAKNTDQRVYWYENPLPKGNPAGGNWREHRVGPTKDTAKGDYIKDYAVADFDGDGRMDIVVCTFDSPAEIDVPE